MLICSQAFVKKERPQKIYCKARDGGTCLHVRYCAVSMKYYQTDQAKECPMEVEKNG